MTRAERENPDRPSAINVALSDKKDQFRLALRGHKAVEAGAVCLVLTVQGHLENVMLAHMLIAFKTGAPAVFPFPGVTFIWQARRFAVRWTAATVLGLCTFLADAVIHESSH